MILQSPLQSPSPLLFIAIFRIYLLIMSLNKFLGFIHRNFAFDIASCNF